jgi:hypothetical protein
MRYLILACGRGSGKWEVGPNSDEGTDTVVLKVSMYFMLEQALLLMRSLLDLLTKTRTKTLR